MLAGKLKLKADGFGTGLADFSATLTFEKESIGKDKYKPVIGLFGIGGQKYNAHKCEACSIISFEYNQGKNNK
jgi:hypothetical protein